MYQRLHTPMFSKEMKNAINANTKIYAGEAAEVILFAKQEIYMEKTV